MEANEHSSPVGSNTLAFCSERNLWYCTSVHLPTNDLQARSNTLHHEEWIGHQALKLVRLRGLSAKSSRRHAQSHTVAKVNIEVPHPYGSQEGGNLAPAVLVTVTSAFKTPLFEMEHKTS